MLWANLFGVKYSRMDQVNFVEDRIVKVFHVFYLHHSWMLCSIYSNSISIYHITIIENSLLSPSNPTLLEKMLIKPLFTEIRQLKI